MNINTRLADLKSQMQIEPETVSLSLESFIKELVEKLEREGTVLGLSGGIDSAVIAALCKRAVGPAKTLALIMPEKDSQAEHVEDAIHFARELGIEARLIDISTYLKQLGAYELFILTRVPFLGKRKGTLVKKAYNYYKKETGESPFLTSLLGFKGKKFGSYLKKINAYYRIKHRLRMMLLYLYGELENKLVVGTANKTEYHIGFFVKHGCDNAADIMPLLNLYKTQVIGLAGYLNIPSKIIDKQPSPDILPGVVDEDAIGMPYQELDLVLLAFEGGWADTEVARDLKIDADKVTYIKNLVQKSEHMRKIYAPSK